MLRAVALPPDASREMITVCAKALSPQTTTSHTPSGASPAIPGGSGGNCVEVATNLPGLIAVRDSKNPAAPALLLTPAHWRTLTAALHVSR